MKPFKGISFSDSHLGRNRIDTVLMVQNLRELIFPLLKDVQFVNMGGDLFDSALGFGDPAVLHIMSFLIQFLSICDELKITVRFLKGTHSHDRTQLETAVVMHRDYGFTNDFRYFDKISLEYIEHLDMRCLYIPDNTPYRSSEEVMEVVRQLMDSAGWDYVDYVFMHAYFEHVLPEGAPLKGVIFRMDQFKFVKRGVMIGHVHTPSANGMFYYHGSSDRVSQGEEEKKGALLIDDPGDGGQPTFKFIENKNAFVFRAYSLSHIAEVSDMVEYVEKKLEKENLDRPVFIRIEHRDATARHACVRILKQRYPTVDISHRAPKDKDRHRAIMDSKETLEALSIISSPTKENLPEAILVHLKTTNVPHNLTVSDVSTMLDNLRKGTT